MSTAPVIEPLPDATEKVTVAPATAPPPESFTMTDGAVGSVLAGPTVWLFPSLIVMSASSPHVKMGLLRHLLAPHKPPTPMWMSETAVAAWRGRGPTSAAMSLRSRGTSPNRVVSHGRKAAGAFWSAVAVPPSSVGSNRKIWRRSACA
ncbi:MAG: hypothetical protein DMD45_01390 [Gemmatimonadetes bacterium]|nr:MAG: hypothetical protein DMD45_01390 [Gemmatimonadota bacterium]